MWEVRSHLQGAALGSESSCSSDPETLSNSLFKVGAGYGGSHRLDWGFIPNFFPRID